LKLQLGKDGSVATYRLAFCVRAGLKPRAPPNVVAETVLQVPIERSHPNFTNESDWPKLTGYYPESRLSSSRAVEVKDRERSIVDLLWETDLRQGRGAGSLR
jgi:hypothetical protein